MLNWVVFNYTRSNRKERLYQMAEEKPKSQLDAALEAFEAEVAECKVIRKELIDQLREDAKKMRIADGDKAMMIQSKLAITNTLGSMLKDVEDSSLKVLKMRLARKEQENNGEYSKAIVEMLKMIRADGKDSNNSNRPMQSEEDIQKSIESRGKDLNIEISPGEIEECAGAPSSAPPPEEEKKETKKE